MSNAPLITTIESLDHLWGCAFCNSFDCAGECQSFVFINVVGIIVPALLESIPPKDLTLTTTYSEQDCHNDVPEVLEVNDQEEDVPTSRVIKTQADWSEEDEVKKFFYEVAKWAKNQEARGGGDWQEIHGDAMLKYAELLVSHPDQPLGFYMQSIKNARIDQHRKNETKNKVKGGKVLIVSIDSEDEQDQVGYYDTYDFEYDMELTETEQATIAELAEWEDSASENTLSKDNRNLYKKVAKIEKNKAPEVERKTVVFARAQKGIDLRDDVKTQKELSSDVEVKTMTQFDRLKKKVADRQKWSKPYVPNDDAPAAEENEPDLLLLMANPEWANAEPDW